MNGPSIEARLEEQQRRFRTLLEHCVDGIIVIDDSGTMLEFSSAAERIFGYEAGEVLGRNVSMLMPEPDRSRHDGYIRNYLDGAPPRILGIGRVVIAQRKDGTTFPMNLSVADMPDGPHRQFVGIVRDATERQQLEQQLRQAVKMEALGQLTGGIAHDFNNLLAILMMDLELLEDRVREDEEGAELVGEALEVTRTGAELTQSLLAFARRQTLTPSRIEVGRLVIATIQLLQRTLGESIRIDMICDSDLWSIVADAAQLENAIVNLAVNARDAMEGQGTLSIEATNFPIDKRRAPHVKDLPPGDYVRIRVADTGCGMTPETLERVFEPFFTTKEGGHGTGLGLAMVYGFVRQSGGHIAARSETGNGTAIDMYFPRATAAGPGEKPATEAAVAGHGRILLVEDNPRLRERTARALADMGYAVDRAVDAAHARSCLRVQGPYDLLLTDIVMPGDTDGEMLAREAATDWPEMRIVLMTGYADRETPADMTVLRKPFTRAALSRAVRAAPGKRA